MTDHKNNNEGFCKIANLTGNPQNYWIYYISNHIKRLFGNKKRGTI